MEAGVRFIALSEEALGQIRKWIRTELSPSHLQKELEKARRAQNLRVARQIFGSRARDKAFQEDGPADPFVPDPVYRPQEVEAPVTAPRDPKPAGIPCAREVLKTRLGAENRRRNIGVLGRESRRIATIAALIVVITFTVGWIARNLNAGNHMPLMAGVRRTAVTAEVAKSEPRPLERQVTKLLAPDAGKVDPPAQREESIPPEEPRNFSTALRNLPRHVRTVERSFQRGIIEHPKLPPQKAPAPTQMTKEPTLAPAIVYSPPIQTSKLPQVGSLPAQPPQPETNVASAVSSDPGPAKDASPVEPKKSESLPSSSKLPERPANMTGLIAVQTDPYPSLRIPKERSSKKSLQGKTLQFGHLVSRVEPAYPEEAKQRGIEGTVRLHAVFGRDGAVESLSPISGPPVLVAAAMNAVRAWHYSQTLLDNKSIEIEEDISVEFRLANSAAARN